MIIMVSETKNKRKKRIKEREVYEIKKCFDCSK